MDEAPNEEALKVKAPGTCHSAHTKSHTSRHPGTHNNPWPESAFETRGSGVRTPGGSAPVYTRSAETRAPLPPRAVTRHKIGAGTSPALPHRTRPPRPPRTGNAKASVAPDHSCANTPHPNARGS